jgi:hemoglobin/transferrin/lactoferrin receptor protein
VIASLAACPAVAAETGASTNRMVVAETMVVTARERETPLSQTPGSIGVISLDDIRDRRAVSLSDLAGLTPGVARNSDGPWGSDINIRGLSRESVVMLVDGVRVNTATDLGGRFGFLDPLAIERVEILKGPISSLYGSGSIGGVVHVLTRKGKFADQPEWHGGASARGSLNPDGFGGFAFGDYDSPDFYLYAGQSYRDYGSYRAGGGEEVPNTQFQDNGTHLRAGYKASRFYRVEGNVQYFRGRDIGIPGSGTSTLPAAADVTYRDATRGMVSLVNTFLPGGDSFKESRLNLYYQYIERDVVVDRFSAANALQEITPTGKHDTYGAKWFNVLELGEHHVTVGPDVWRRHLISTRTRVFKDGRRVEDEPLPESSFLSAGAFVEDDWRVAPAVNLNGGGRWDFIRVENDATAQWPEGDEEDGSWDLHLGGTWDLADALSVKLVGGSGYRAASLEERFQYLELGGGKVKYGAPDLDPERSLFAECGLNLHESRWEGQASVFYNQLSDMIGERTVDAATIVNANIREAEIYGVELESRWRPASDWRVYGNVSYAVGRDTSDDEYLAGVPPLGGLVGVAYGGETGPRGRLETVFAARQDKVPDGADEAPGWMTVNAELGWRFLKAGTEHEISVGVNNLFDTEYRNYLSTYRRPEFSEPGRSCDVSYRLAF